MIQHHPDDALLLDLATGTLAPGRALLVATHVEGCAQCAQRLRLLDALGGALLEDLAPARLRADALARTLAAIDAEAAAPVPVPVPVPATLPARRPALPEGMQWPAAMDGCDIGPWRWLGPGMRWSRVRLPADPAANLFLLRIGAGKMLPRHTHTDNELTQVLWGSFHDGRARFGPGDFDEADTTVLHQPTVAPEGECICLASVDGRVAFEGWLARRLGALVGM